MTVLTQTGDPRSRRHSTATVLRAQRMYDNGNGWRVGQIAGFLGVSPSTVKRWVAPGEVERTNDRRMQLHRHKRGNLPVEQRPISPLRLDDLMLALKARGVSYKNISAVVDLYHGEQIHPDRVRARLVALGVPVNPVRSEAMRRLNESRRVA